MERNEDQDLMDVLKYNQDRLKMMTENAEKSTAKLDDTLKESKVEPYDFSEVDSDIARALEVLELFEVKKALVVEEEYVPEKYSVIVPDSVAEQTWEELVWEAGEAGYIDIKIEDILTPEEIADADARYHEIEATFKEKTRLRKKDVVFLVTAVALQCVRQYVLTPFDERVTSGTSSGASQHGKRYHVPYEEIIGTEKVPYDTIAGSKKFGLGGDGKGLSGNTHRYRTLGHDPILGYIFGTANILTNTLTAWNIKSYHIKKVANASGVMMPTIAQNADTGKMFSVVKDRFKTDKKSIAAAIAKQHIHITSDFTTNGLPIPFLSLISPEKAEILAEYGVDSVALKKVGEQAGLSLLINFIISTVHTLMRNELRDGKQEMYEVRTRKVLLYSNLIASTSNVVAVGIGAALGAVNENPELTKKSLKYLDVGGLLVTIGRLFSDVRFITRVKDEFIKMELDKDIQAEIDEIDSVLNELNGVTYLQ